MVEIAKPTPGIEVCAVRKGRTYSIAAAVVQTPSSETRRHEEYEMRRSFFDAVTTYADDDNVQFLVALTVPASKKESTEYGLYDCMGCMNCMSCMNCMGCIIGNWDIFDRRTRVLKGECRGMLLA